MTLYVITRAKWENVGVNILHLQDKFSNKGICKEFYNIQSF